MCVTNISKRSRPMAVGNAAMAASTPSLISQRLMGNFMPMMLNTTTAKPQQSIDTAATNTNMGPTFATIGSCAVPNSFSYFPQNELAQEEPKKRPKRRRKPQKPGKTAKLNERHFVVHNYHDHANDPDENDTEEDLRKRGGVSISFPMKLHAFLDQVETDGLSHVVSWQTHGRCFVIHKPKEFAEYVMPRYFRQSKLTSFQRQLNLYGFCRLTRGKDSGGYYHELFLRGRAFLTKRMQRTKVKGTKFKAASSPDQEPDFYTMAPVAPNSVTSDESSIEGVGAYQIAVKRSIPDHDFNVVNMNAPISFEPIPLSVPRSSTLPTMEPYPLMGQQTMPQQSSRNVVNQDFNLFSTIVPGFAQCGSNLFKSQADQVLDDAVDELFSDDPLMSDTQALDGLWDTSAFGEEGVQDDIQLGYMLEKILDA